MATQNVISREDGNLLKRYPVASYFTLTFTISWTGALAIAAPRLLGGEALPKFTGIMMFPIMLLGPSLAGIVLTGMTEGQKGLPDLFSRMKRVRIPVRWYAALFIPPAMMLSVLLCLKTFVSPIFAPNRFFVGISFGMVAGFFEEIGWTGYAFPKMAEKGNPLASSLLLGVLWGTWHLPVIDYLGTATPHGAYWFRYFLAFAAAMAAMRVLIAWIYTNTKSVPLAQLMHASSTGSLVLLSPPGVTAAQETMWYAVYAGALWIAVVIIVTRFGTKLMRQSAR